MSGAWAALRGSVKQACLTPGSAGLDAHTLYLFRVRATNAAGVGQWSALARIATAPAPPSQPLGLVAAGTEVGVVGKHHALLFLLGMHA